MEAVRSLTPPPPLSCVRELMEVPFSYHVFLRLDRENSLLSAFQVSIYRKNIEICMISILASHSRLLADLLISTTYTYSSQWNINRFGKKVTIQFNCFTVTSLERETISLKYIHRLNIFISNTMCHIHMDSTDL